MNHATKQKIGVLAPCLGNQSFLCLSAVIAQMAQAFPHADVAVVQLTFTLPSLMVMVAALAGGRLARYFYKKHLLLLGIAMTTLGGLAGLLCTGSLVALLMCSAVIGLGVGINLTLSYAIICDYYEGAERGQLMGWNTSFVCIGGALFSFLGGKIAANDWRLVYLTFFLLVPVLVAVWRWCPQGYLEKGNQSGVRTRVSPYFVILTLLGVVCFAFQNSFNANSSLYLSEMGRYTMALSSTSTVMNSLGGIIGGLCFGFLLKKLKNQIQSAAFLLSGVSFLLMGVLQLLSTLFAGGFLIGFAFALVNAGSSMLIANTVLADSRAMMIAIYNAMTNIGAASSPFVVNTLARVVQDSALVRFQTAGIALLICGGASIIFQNARTQTKS